MLINIFSHTCFPLEGVRTIIFHYSSFLFIDDFDYNYIFQQKNALI